MRTMYFRRYADAKNCNVHVIKFGIHKVISICINQLKIITVLLIISIYEFLNLSELIQGFNA